MKCSVFVTAYLFGTIFGAQVTFLPRPEEEGNQSDDRMGKGKKGKDPRKWLTDSVSNSLLGPSLTHKLSDSLTVQTISLIQLSSASHRTGTGVYFVLGVLVFLLPQPVIFNSSKATT